MSTVNSLTGGAFQDSDGNVLADGYLVFKLNQDGVVNTSTEVCSGEEITIPLDGSGNIVTSPTYSLWPNDAMTPSGSFYYVSAYAASGQRVWGPNPQTVLSSPSPYNVGAWVPGSI